MTDLAERVTESRSASLLEAFRDHVERDPGGVAFRFLDAGCLPGTTLSRQELDSRARAVAVALTEQGVAGERALLALPAGLDFLVAFFGCLHAGVTAVPCPPERADRLVGIGQDAGVAAVLTDSAVAPTVRDGWSAGGGGKTTWLEVDRAPVTSAELWTPPLTRGDDLALLQYTSGSTGRPKGVAVTADNLNAQLVNFRDLTRLPTGGNVVSWMPVFHALGLGHLLLSQLVGGEGVFMTPDTAVAQPYRWLDAITATEAPVVSGGPNFAYQRCIDHVTDDQRARLDLSGWHAALVGGERIRARTLTAFAETFAACGFRHRALLPAYGLTETMQIVVARSCPESIGVGVDAAELERGRVRAAGGGDRTRTLVSCGTAGPGGRVLVVDPDTRTVCGDGTVGEVWIDGPVVCQGYWKHPEETAETFHAHLRDGDGDDGPLLRTGDLGFLHEGELVICGRLKELVIVNGRNLHPQDLELTAQNACSGRAAPQAAAFSVDVDEQERLVVVQAVTAAEDDPGLDALAGRIRQAVTAEHRTEPYEVVLVEPASVPTTDSGKVRRGACRDAYLRGRLNPLAVSRAAAPATTSATAPSGTEGEQDARPFRDMVTALAPELRGPVVTAEVGRRLAAALGRTGDEPPADRPLAAMGMESLRTIALRHSLERDFGVSLPTADFFRGTAADIAAAVLRRLDDEYSDGSPWPPLVADPGNRYEPFPLTALQHAYLVGRAASYDLGGTSIHLYAEHDSPDLDLDRLSLALDTLVERQEMLRAVVSSDGSQHILPEAPSVPIREYDLRGAGEQAVSDHLNSVREELGHQVVPLDTWPMFDIRVTWLEGRHARVHVSLDLLIFDVASVRLFFMEWGDLYRDPDARLPELDVSFRDFVLAAEGIPTTGEYQRSRAYWMQRLETLPPSPELPLLVEAEQADGRPLRARRHDRLDAERWNRLKERAAQLGVTPTSVLLAAYATALGTWSRTSHFTVDVPLFSRFPMHPHIDRILGDFTSVSLLEVDLRPDDGVAALAQRLQQQMWRDLEHRYFSGVEVMREAARVRGIPASAFASVVFASTREHGRDQSFQQGEWGSSWLGELVHGITQTPQVLLDHQVYERDGALTFNWDAVERRFPAGLLDDMFGTYLRLLHELADCEGSWEAGGFTAVPAWQRELVAAAHDTEGPVPEDLLFSGVAEQAGTHPDRTAVITSRRTLTYGELYGHACRIARRLRELGALPNQLVAVSMDKSAEQIVGAVAVQVAGAAYLPIDPELPADRRAHMLTHGQVSLVLTRQHGPDTAPDGDWPQGITEVVVDLDGVEPDGTDRRPPEPLQCATDLAYVLYTSGSTGEPKGVMQTHRATLNTLVDANERMAVGPEDRALGLSSLSFDLSVWDVFGVLGRGAALVLPDPGAERDPAHWLDLMAEHGVTLWNSVPALMRMLVEHASGAEAHPSMAALRRVWFSGDWIPVDLPGRVRELAPGARVIASGGPTETAIWCVANPLEEIDPGWESIPYGRPMRNHTVHILDERLEPCPVWCPGEMYIGGVGLADGYWRDPERTARSFLTHPRTGERLYRSGDMGRWLPTGELEILGREDFQVKIGGFRIELGEIESTLVRHDAVRSATVVAAGPDRHRRSLAAFVVPEYAESAPAAGHDVHGEDLGDVVTDPVARLEHKARQPGLRIDLDGARTALPVALTDDEADTLYERRASHRVHAEHPVPFADLARLLENLRGRETGALPKYRYASAGSLYPVQTYVYVAADRVEGLERGTYYHDPIGHRLVAVRTGVRLDRDIHVPDNHAVFEQSAFTILLVAQRHAIEPLYGLRTRDFCLLEAGLMAQLLDDAAADCGLGLCQVGLIRETEQLREALAFDDGHMVLHGLVGGARCHAGTAVERASAPAAANEEVRSEEALSEELRRHLGAKLPAYMVPASVVAVDRIPLTPRGKVDRKALEESARRAQLAGSSPQSGTAGSGEEALPRTETEKAITPVVREVLGAAHIGATDNFFDLGADSVVVVKVHRQLRKELGREFPLMTMFEHPNIRSLAAFLSADEASPDGGAGGSARVGFERASRRAARRRRGRGSRNGEA